MTYQDIAEVVSSIGIPYAYRVFRDKQALPYCIFYYPDIDDPMADNANYERLVRLRLELYTDNKNFLLEAQVETALLDNGLPFSKVEDYVESERMYMTTYESEVFING